MARRSCHSFVVTGMRCGFLLLLLEAVSIVDTLSFSLFFSSSSNRPCDLGVSLARNTDSGEKICPLGKWTFFVAIS